MGKNVAARIVLWIFLVVVLFVTLFPFYWVIKTSLTFPPAVFTNPAAVAPATMLACSA